MTADDAIRMYYRMRDSFGAPALNFVDSTGRMHADTCAKCGGKKRHETKVGDWVCGHCGANWPYVDRFIFKGEVQKSPSSRTFDDVHARYFDVARALDGLLRAIPWDARLYIANVMGYNLRQLERDFPITFPEATGSFSRRSISRRIKVAREAWTSRLRAIKIRVTE